LSNFSVTERISWAGNRETTRKEDKAYSLLGIFDIYMPIIYGEGRENAFMRLTEEVKERVVSLAPSRALSQAPQSFYPLKDSGFRIFALDPGERGSKITGYIQEWDLREPPKYNALSYVWGDEPAVHPIDINYEESLIRPSLFHALQRIRDSRRSVNLWVDSLCINQSDESERNAQIRRMADIFHNANSVWIWLGEEDSTSKIALEFIPQIIDHDFRWDGVWWEKPNFTAFNRILARAWFRRRWVIQEAAFSTNSVILCGDRTVDMNHFTRAVSLVRTKLGSISRSFGTTRKNMPHKGFLANFRDSPATRLLDIIEDVFDRPSEAIPSRRLSLEALVVLGTFCETTDQRDTIFALLNLANDTDSPSQPGLTDLLVPDYNSSLLDVFADFVLHCCRRSGSLDIICRPWAPVSSSAMQAIGQIDLVDPALHSNVPSWIASRDGLPFGATSWDMTHRLHGKSLVGSSRKQVYNAHYYTKPQVDLGRSESKNTRFGSLYAKGVVLGEITQRSTRMADAIITNESLDILRMNPPVQQLNPRNLPDTIWRTLCADRDSQGEPAPSRYRSAMAQLLQFIFEAPTTSHRSNQVKPVSSIDVEEFLETNLPEEVENFLEVVRDVVWNRRTFQGKRKDGSGSPIVGLISRYAQVGDQLCILYGCSVPVVLRKHSWGDDHHWQLIGEAYVYGFMDGEGISSMSPAMLKSVEVEFEI
jgi:Heterokaryon incompatibility protein (HET)